MEIDRVDVNPAPLPEEPRPAPPPEREEEQQTPPQEETERIVDLFA